MAVPYPAQTKGEGVAIGIAVGSLALGFIVVWLAREFIGSVDGSVLIALLLLPLIVYLSASGRLAEFKAPEGIEAKFAQAAAESVSSASETVAYDDPQIVAKEGVRNLIQRKTKEIDESKPVVMTMTIGGQAQYSPQDVEQYIGALSQFRNFKFVIFLDRDDKFVAYMPTWALKYLLQVPDLAWEFLNAVNPGTDSASASIPRCRQEDDLDEVLKCGCATRDAGAEYRSPCRHRRTAKALWCC